MIRALVFDFDGVIADTEEIEFRSWLEVYEEHGGRLSADEWASIIGRSIADVAFDPHGTLEAQIGRTLDRAAVRAHRRLRFEELNQALGPLPGVVDYLAESQRLGLRLGVASSSSHGWVDGQLQRFGPFEHFQIIRCREDVDLGKPNPAVYRAVLDELGCAPEEAIAIEDSEHGVAAAKGAGLYCVAVPTRLTRSLALGAADLILDSLASYPLRQLLETAVPR